VPGDFGLPGTGYAFRNGGKKMSLGTIILIVLVLLLVGAIPSWPHSRSWGYAPSGVLGTILLIVLILFLLGKI
jgi:hypothetical protein